MGARFRLLVVAVAALLAPAPAALPSGRAGAAGPELRARAMAAAARAPATFEPNVGQGAPRVRWLARARGLMLLLADDEAVFRLGGPAGPDHPRTRIGNARGNPRPRPGGVLRMGFEGAAPSPRFEAAARQAGVSHYFLGNDPERWRSGVPRYDGVALRALWPGVDLRFRGDAGGVAYDLLLAAGADPSAARFRLSGPEALRVDGNGDLLLSFPGGLVRQSAPVAWQEDAGRRIPVAAAFRLLGDGLLGFEVGPRDPALPLVIDPKVGFASYLGGSQSDWPLDVAVDSAGGVLVAGLTNSTDFPLASPFQSTYAGGSGNFPDDAFVTKYSANLSTVVFSTFLGGSGFDDCYGVAADAAGNVHLAGITSSTNFPTQSPRQASNAGGYDDMYVVKMAPGGGTLLFSTYLGSAGSDDALDIAVDSSGSIFVAGATSSGAFPLAAPIQSAYGGGAWDAVVLKMASNGATLTWSTLHGGSGIDYAYGIALDPAGAVYATGVTNSTNFPTINPLQSAYAGGNGPFPDDAFLVKVAPSGSSLAYATYLGGSGYDDCYSVGATAAGEACLAGFTSSPDFPVATAFQGTPGGGTDDAYVVKVDAAGSALLLSSYIGGSGQDQAYGVGVDSAGSVFACGLTNSTDFPMLNAFQSTYVGGGTPFPDDAWVAKVGPGGAGLRYSSYIQSNGFDDPSSLALDLNGNPIVVGFTSSAAYPLVNPVQATFGGGPYDAYVVRLAIVPPTDPSLLTAQAAGSSPVRLAWTDNSADETGFEVERRTAATSFASVALLLAGAKAYDDFAVAPATTYTYRVRAINGDGASAYTNEASATTSAVIPLPAAPDGLAAVPVSATGIALAWNDRSTNEISFEVQRKPEGGAFALVANLPEGAVSWTDSGLGPDAPYTYRVRAVGLAGASGYSAEAAATTDPTLTLLPAKGALADSAKALKDKVKVSGTFDFLPASADGSLDPAGEGVVLRLVGEVKPLGVAIAAGDEGWKVKGTKYTWKSPKGSAAKVVVVLDTARRTFSVSVSKVDLQEAATASVRVSLRCGGDAGTSRAGWTLKKPGVYKYP